MSYTNIVTRYDEVVLPYTSGYLTGDNTTNIKLQDKCRYDVADHLLIPMDGPAIRLVLERPGAQRAGRPGVPALLPALIGSAAPNG